MWVDFLSDFLCNGQYCDLYFLDYLEKIRQKFDLANWGVPQALVHWILSRHRPSSGRREGVKYIVHNRSFCVWVLCLMSV
jgi:hypothetical protein